jgi:hypothetical protein
VGEQPLTSFSVSISVAPLGAVPPLLTFGRNRIAPMKHPEDRVSIDAHDFCRRCSLDAEFAGQVDRFRSAFSCISSLERDQIYPEDEATALGINYSDDLAMFLFDEGLLTNERFHYDFPMEEASSIGDIIRLTLELNNQAEQDVHGNTH